MRIEKHHFLLFFLLSVSAYLVAIPIESFLILIAIFLVLSIINFKNNFETTFPFGEFISLVFFIDNTLAIAVLYILKGSELRVGDFLYTQVELQQYIPFSFLCSQALLLGYLTIKQDPGKPWINFVKNFNKLINRNNLRLLIIFGSFGIFLQFFKLTPFVALLLTSFFNCGLIGFALYTQKPNNIYILMGFGISVLSASTSGMFGNLIYFVIYYLLIYVLILAAAEKKINWVKSISIGVVVFYFLALVQNVKNDYRSKTWGVVGQATSQNFYKSLTSSFETKSPFNVDFYLPLLFRLNQGYLVTAAMYKVPYQEPFANGSTIFTSVIDAFVPRVLNQEKEEAGGRQKIKRFTNITLVGETSMNLGLLGETYANFGKMGSIIFMFVYGFLIALFNKKVLQFSYKYPIILVFFPIFFQFLVGSGSDFLWVFNGIVKSSMLIFVIILLFNWQKKQKMINTNVRNLEVQ